MVVTADADKLLDDIGWQLLRDLQENARLPFAELGRRVGLSLPAVAERVRRMEEAGIILGYRAEVNAEKLGLPYQAVVKLQTSSEHYSEIVQMAERLTEVIECHHITGSDAFLLKVVVSSMAHLEEFIGKLGVLGQIDTSLILSSPVTRRLLDKPAPSRLG